MQIRWLGRPPLVNLHEQVCEIYTSNEGYAQRQMSFTIFTISQFFYLKMQKNAVYLYYYAKNKDYTPSKMTISEFVNFMLDKVAKDKTFSLYFDEKSLEQIKSLKLLEIL